MTIQRSQGALRPMVAPLDELPAPMAAVAVPANRRPNGTFADSETARANGARGGRARAGRARLVSALGLSALADDAAFKPDRDAGDAWVREHLERLAMQVGAPGPGPGPSSIIVSAGVQLAASRFLSDKAAATGDAKLFQLASQLANDSRQNLLAAFELAVREAKARKERPIDPEAFAKLMAEAAKPNDGGSDR